MTNIDKYYYNNGFEQMINEINYNQFKEDFDNAISLSELAIKYYGYNNGKGTKYIRNLCSEYNLDIEEIKKHRYNHFHPLKNCAYCGKEFNVKYPKSSREQICCSSKCANNYYKNDGRYEKISLILTDKLNKCNNTVEKICKRCGGVYYSDVSGFIKSKYCPLCKERYKTEHNCELRETKCNKCGKIIYVKTTIEPSFCMDCYDTYEELKDIRHYQEYDKNGKKIYSKKYKENMSKKIQENVKNGKHKGWITRNITSFPERFFKKVLYNNNIEYEFNYPISKKKLGLNNIASYFLDFKIGNNIDLEIDGKQHKYKNRIMSDKLRDEILTKNGYKVYRIEWNEINSKEGKLKMKEKISNFLKWYEDNK